MVAKTKEEQSSLLKTTKARKKRVKKSKPGSAESKLPKGTKKTTIEKDSYVFKGSKIIINVFEKYTDPDELLVGDEIVTANGLNGFIIKLDECGDDNEIYVTLHDKTGYGFRCAHYRSCIKVGNGRNDPNYNS